MMEAQRAAATPPSDVRAVIFDWDQTLWDSWTLHLNAIKHAASFVGHAPPSTQRVLDTFSGALEHHLLRIYGSQDGPMRGYREYYLARRLDLAGLFPGVSDVLAALRAAGYKVAVLSDKIESAGREEVSLAGLDSVLHAAVFRDGTCLTKPAPDGLLRTLDMLGVKPAEAVYAGDAPWDIECARRAGVVSVGALWGSLDVGALMAAAPDHTWRTPHDALAFLRTTE